MRWIVSGTKLERHLIFRSKIQLLQMTALVQIPDVQLVAVAAFEQDLGIQSVLHHVGRAPFAEE